MYFESELAQDHSAELTRQIDMDIVPIVRPDKYDLSVISTNGRHDPREFTRYTHALVNDFAGSSLKVQVLIADNTREHSNRPNLERMGEALSEHGIDLGYFHVPQPGKPYGLNKCLAAVRAPIVEPVDMNKYPAYGTLRGLYDDVRVGMADLVSSRIFRPNFLGQVPQFWCAGQAYAGKREYFPGFPQVLNEDEYIHLLTLARGGSFAISDRHLYDKVPSSPHEAARRVARVNAGSQQLHYITVRDREVLYRLGEVCIEQPQPSAKGLGCIAGSIYSLARSPLGYKRSMFTRIISQATQRISPETTALLHTQALERLIENPTICAWS